MKTFLQSLVSALLGWAVVAVAGWYFLVYESNPIAEYYKIENAVTVSPHGLRKNIEAGKNKAIIVDLRSAEEYKEAHIKGAINIPAYKDKDTSAYDQVDRIVGDFQKLPKDKEIIVYCYSRACMTGRKVGKMLADKGIYVKHLGIGWNEWRYDWKSWNHPHEWDITDPMDYIEGTLVPKKANTGSRITPVITPCSVDSTFGC